MANEFDPYREALVMEEITIWPDEYDSMNPADRTRLERLLHEQPAEAAVLEYERQHSGFARKITVTPTDVERLGQGAA